ncbi:MAG: Rieske 2Fe-2S domain-containing protein [Proteobacteria bacterium]|nr:Rieske 2Fe-2S domain-containing protein [Pseudomonadota bacterium]
MTRGIEDLVSADATLVSRRAFTDEAVYKIEKERIFGRAWLYLAHESELKASGDFVTTYMGETPVIVARGPDGRINASVNSCTHRGVAVCHVERGHASRFICPYHNWTFGMDGRLLAIPQQGKIERPVDKARLGLRQVPRVESYAGLIFGSFDPDVAPLEQYLGNMRFYLDNYFARFADGVEVVGAPHKWRLAANWKLPVENQLGDVGHGPFLHGAVLGGRDAIAEIEAYGFNMVPEPGHGAAIRLLPPETPLASRMWGSENGSASAFSAETQAFLLDTQRQMEDRLGSVHARIKGLTYGVYPNFSFLWANSTIRVSHPRGPGKVEYWSWWVVPAGAPESVKRELQGVYNGFFGPGGLLEQEDSDAWAQQYAGSAIDYMDDHPYYYGLGAGEEEVHPLLPGVAGSCYNEHYARQFYLRWQRDIAEGAAR